VKFFAAACAWIGAGLGWRAAIASALVGGVLGVIWVVAGLGVRRGAVALALEAARRASGQRPPNSLTGTRRSSPTVSPWPSASRSPPGSRSCFPDSTG
jgi:hypothetical protein